MKQVLRSFMKNSITNVSDRYGSHGIQLVGNGWTPSFTWRIDWYLLKLCDCTCVIVHQMQDNIVVCEVRQEALLDNCLVFNADTRCVIPCNPLLKISVKVSNCYSPLCSKAALGVQTAGNMVYVAGFQSC